MMSLFDSFYLKAECPYCHEKGVFEFHTKLFRCVLADYCEGDDARFGRVNIKEGLIKDVYGGCNSEICRKWEKKHAGYNSGFGREFNCDVEIKKGKILRAINIKKVRLR